MRIIIRWLVFILFLIPITVQGQENEIDWAVSDFEPPAGIEATPENVDNDGYGPWNRRILIAISDDNGLTWERTGQLISDQSDYPTAIITLDGRIFVYFMTYHPDYRNQIVQAISDDLGETWVYKVTQFDFDDSPPPVVPSVILLDDGRIRMFFNHKLGLPQVSIFSAVSSDGLHFERDTEVAHYFLPDEFVLAPSILRFENGFHVYALNPTGANRHAYSEDGVTFMRQEDITLESRHLISQGMLETGDGLRVFTFDGAPASETFTPAVHSYFSADGFEWEREPGERLTYDSTIEYESVTVRNPAVILLPDDRVMMFYITVIPE